MKTLMQFKVKKMLLGKEPTDSSFYSISAGRGDRACVSVCTES